MYIVDGNTSSTSCCLKYGSLIFDITHMYNSFSVKGQNPRFYHVFHLSGSETQFNCYVG